MQRLGPPPAYPHLRVPGVNAPLPPGAKYGFQPGGWGRPPVDEATGAALFGGDPLGVGSAGGGTSVDAVSSEELAEMENHWGEFPEDFTGLDEDGEREDDDMGGEMGENMGDEKDTAVEGDGMADDDDNYKDEDSHKSAGAGSGFESSSVGMATPAAIDLVKRTAASVEAEQQVQQVQPQVQQQPQAPRPLYTVLEQQAVANPVATVSAHSLLGATHTYRLPGAEGTDQGAVAPPQPAEALETKHEQEAADAHELQQRYQDIAQPGETKKPKKKKNKDKDKFKF